MSLSQVLNWRGIGKLNQFEMARDPEAILIFGKDNPNVTEWNPFPISIRRVEEGSPFNGISVAFEARVEPTHYFVDVKELSRQYFRDGLKDPVSKREDGENDESWTEDYDSSFDISTRSEPDPHDMAQINAEDGITDVEKRGTLDWYYDKYEGGPPKYRYDFSGDFHGNGLTPFKKRCKANKDCGDDEYCVGYERLKNYGLYCFYLKPNPGDPPRKKKQPQIS